MAEHKDIKLVKMCLEGDSIAWEMLVNRYRRLIYHFPSKSGLNVDQSDDVFQETCLALFNQLQTISRTDDLSFWVASVAQRLTWKAIQKKNKEGHESINEVYDVASPDLIPEDNLLIKHQQHHVRSALHSLDPKCRELLMELFFSSEESDYKSVANRLGLSMGSIGPTRNRCLEKLKKLLKAQGLKKNSIFRIKNK